MGLLVGVLGLGLFVNYLVSHAISGASTQGTLFGGAIDQVREGIAKTNTEQNSLSVYGHVVSIGGGTLVLEAVGTQGKKDLTFTYDNATNFVYLANDAASTEVPLSADSIEVGTGLNIYANEAIGSVANQYAVKVIKI